VSGVAQDDGIVQNEDFPQVDELSDGGCTHSGYGKELSMDGFEDHSRVEHVMSDVAP